MDESKRDTADVQYDILVPLTRLYRNGHIQANDPVYLPPIQPSQLPDCLRARGDLQKRRNVWHLGAAVARYVLDMSIMKRLSPIRTIEAHRRAVQVMAHYVVSKSLPFTHHMSCAFVHQIACLLLILGNGLWQNNEARLSQC